MMHLIAPYTAKHAIRNTQHGYWGMRMANIFKPPCDAGVIRSRPATAPCTASAEPWVLAATILGSSMAFIDGTVVNVALPALQRDLNATVADVQWVVEAYALFLAALI